MSSWLANKSTDTAAWVKASWSKLRKSTGGTDAGQQGGKRGDDGKPAAQLPTPDQFPDIQRQMWLQQQQELWAQQQMLWQQQAWLQQQLQETQQQLLWQAQNQQLQQQFAAQSQWEQQQQQQQQQQELMPEQQHQQHQQQHQQLTPEQQQQQQLQNQWLQAQQLHLQQLWMNQPAYATSERPSVASMEQQQLLLLQASRDSSGSALLQQLMMQQQANQQHAAQMRLSQQLGKPSAMQQQHMLMQQQLPKQLPPSYLRLLMYQQAIYGTPIPQLPQPMPHPPDPLVFPAEPPTPPAPSTPKGQAPAQPQLHTEPSRQSGEAGEGQLELQPEPSQQSQLPEGLPVDASGSVELDYKPHAGAFHDRWHVDRYGDMGETYALPRDAIQKAALQQAAMRAMWRIQVTNPVFESVQWLPPPPPPPAPPAPPTVGSGLSPKQVTASVQHMLQYVRKITERFTKNKQASSGATQAQQTHQPAAPGISSDYPLAITPRPSTSGGWPGPPGMPWQSMPVGWAPPPGTSPTQSMAAAGGWQVPLASPSMPRQSFVGGMPSAFAGMPSQSFAGGMPPATGGMPRQSFAGGMQSPFAGMPRQSFAGGPQAAPGGLMRSPSIPATPFAATGWQPPPPLVIPPTPGGLAMQRAPSMPRAPSMQRSPSIPTSAAGGHPPVPTKLRKKERKPKRL